MSPHRLTLFGLVALGGALGAVLRYLISEWAVRAFGATFPLGTLFANLIGSLIIGLLFGYADTRAEFPTHLVTLLGVGLMGGFTTFSSYAYQTVFLIEEGQLPFALLNLVLNTLPGLLLAALGLYLGRLIPA